MLVKECNGTGNEVARVHHIGGRFGQEFIDRHLAVLGAHVEAVASTRGFQQHATRYLLCGSLGDAARWKACDSGPHFDFKEASVQLQNVSMLRISWAFRQRVLGEDRPDALASGKLLARLLSEPGNAPSALPETENVEDRAP